MILDNHLLHLSNEGVNFCHSNAIVLLSLPPHCSHKMQPLDRTVYGPLKVSKFGLQLYDILSIVKESLPLSATPSSLQEGFYWPFRRDVFKDHEFSLVTDRPLPPTPGSLHIYCHSLHICTFFRSSFSLHLSCNAFACGLHISSNSPTCLLFSRLLSHVQKNGAQKYGCQKHPDRHTRKGSTFS